MGGKQELHTSDLSYHGANRVMASWCAWRYPARVCTTVLAAMLCISICAPPVYSQPLQSPALFPTTASWTAASATAAGSGDKLRPAAVRRLTLGIAHQIDKNGDPLELLRALPALPVTHYAWPFCHTEDSCTEEYMNHALPWSDVAVMREYARVTHSLPVYAGLRYYSNLTARTLDTMWDRLAAGVDGLDATIALQLEALARANLRLGTHARIGAVMVDQEGWGAVDRAKITENNDRVYEACAEVLGRDVVIQYYGRGLSSVNDASASGFWDPLWYTLDEIDNRQLSTSLYTVPERSTMRLQYQRTVAKLLNASVACHSTHRAGNAGWCPDRVVPWISLGAGYKPTNDLITHANYMYTIPWDYPIWYSWELGRDVNNASLRTRSTSYYRWAKAVALYPSPFDPRSPPLVGKGLLTTMLCHFIAYARGAAGIADLTC